MSVEFKCYLNQDFRALKAHHLNEHTLFEDPTFPVEECIGHEITNTAQVFWKRPGELVAEPHLIKNGIEPNDFDQGQLANCWVISAAAAVSALPTFHDYIMPLDQSFEASEYAGIFHFRFWHSNEWIDVVIDDRLPVDEHGRMIFCQNSEDGNEFYGALLEKAYAKAARSYTNLIGGLTSEALVQLTGGIPQMLSRTRDLKEQDPLKITCDMIDETDTWEIMFKAFSMHSFMSTHIQAGEHVEEVLHNQLCTGHAYCVLQLVEILPNDGKYNKLRRHLEQSGDVNAIKLLRLRNPWGKASSWTGRYSAGSRDWSRVNSVIRDQLGADHQVDGQFFISFDDFLQIFSVDIELVHLSMNAFYDSEASQMTRAHTMWRTSLLSGEWVTGESAPGNQNSEHFLSQNPQHVLSIPFTASLIISLLQIDNSPASTKSEYVAMLPLLYKVRANDETIESQVERALSKCANKGFVRSDLSKIESIGIAPYSIQGFMTRMEVARKFRLTPGTYVIFPTLFTKDVSRAYSIRVFVETMESDPHGVQCVPMGETLLQKYCTTNRHDNDNSDAAPDTAINENERSQLCIIS